MKAGRAWLALMLVLGGCAQHPAAPARPPGMFLLIDERGLQTYLSASSVVLYQNNDNLRQFYTINNYREVTTELHIASSRATEVIDCQRGQHARLERVYFTEPFAQGRDVHHKDEEAQWVPINNPSIMSKVQESVCMLSPEKLRAAGHVSTN